MKVIPGSNLICSVTLFSSLLSLSTFVGMEPKYYHTCDVTFFKIHKLLNHVSGSVIFVATDEAVSQFMMFFLLSYELRWYAGFASSN